MRDITVLVTASGAPGTAALLRALRMNGERGVRVVGTDMSPQAVGRHFCDRFYVVPPGRDPGSSTRCSTSSAARTSTSSCRSRRSTCSRSPRRASGSWRRRCWSRRRRRSAPRTTRQRRTRCWSASACAHRRGGRVTGGRALAEAAEELGYPARPVCFKPVFSSGSRGFRVLDATVDRAKQLLEERPGNLAMRLTDVSSCCPKRAAPTCS